MAQTLEGDPFLVSQLVRIAVGNEAIKLAQRGMKEVSWSEADLVRLQTGLREFQFPSALKDALMGERASAFTACFDPQKMVGPKANPTPEDVQTILSRPPQRVADAAKILEIHRRLIASSEQPISQTIRTSHELDAETEKLGKSPITQLTYIMTLLLTPATSFAAEAFAAAAARRDSADASIAAELYRRRQGIWPRKLENLVPKYLPRVPDDPFTDNPLQVKASEEHFAVYSLGRDMQDDGGKFSDRATPRIPADVGFELELKRNR